MILAIFDRTIDWECNHTWKQSAYNTMWCLIGCSIGDMGTIYYFQVNQILLYQEFDIMRTFEKYSKADNQYLII